MKLPPPYQSVVNKRITVITLQNVRNYGSALQALATQHVMEKMGLECNFIDYLKSATIIQYTIKGRFMSR